MNRRIPVKTKTLIIIIFSMIHIIMITGITVYLSFEEYTDRSTLSFIRQAALGQMYEKIIQYKEANGQFPNTLDSFWNEQTDEEGWKMILFGDTILPRVFGDEIIPITRFDYKIAGDEPVLIDLGRDFNEGGLGMNWDIYYPPKYQKPFPFRYFIQSREFVVSLILGFVPGLLSSLCLYGIWIKGFRSDKVTWASMISLIVFSFLYLGFACFVTNIMLYMHVYPTH